MVFLSTLNYDARSTTHQIVYILDVTFFTDEAWSHLSCYVNTPNTRLWSSENPLHKKPLHDQKLGVWVAISRWHSVGPLFFEETVNREPYSSVLHDFIGLLEEDEITYSWFQQDGATAHTANNSMKLLNEIFGERVISRNFCGPPCSPDLTPPEFYLWGQHNLQCIMIAHARLMN